MAMRIRPALAEDLPELGELKLCASLALGDHIEEIKALPEARIVPSKHLPFVFVAEENGQIRGFATVLPRSDGGAELEDMFIDPGHWRRGIGRLLVMEARARARTSGAKTLHVIANSRGFYEACGFQVIGEERTMFAPAPIMVLSLEVRAD